MLVIISDLHLTDGSSGTTISNRAFKIFRERLREMAYEASWREDGSFRPVKSIDIILLGDILDVIRSDKWLNDSIRPWNDPNSPQFLAKIREINDAILENNKTSLSVLKTLGSGDLKNRITLPPEENGRPAKVGHEPESENRITVEINIHYMIGNHDWFYHIDDSQYNTIRKSVVETMGLANNPEKPFAHDPGESRMIMKILDDHNVFARHGDIYDPFNYEEDRNASSLGDAIVVELLNRFPKEVVKQLGDELPKECLDGIKEIDNVRPLLLIPVWIDALLDKTCSGHPDLAKQVKEIWNNLADDFLKLPFVTKRDKWWNPLDVVDKLQLGLKFSSKFSFDAIADVIKWFMKSNKNGGGSYSKFALKEQAFSNKKGFIVYGHTHHTEVVPLDTYDHKNQIHLNSGTWRAVFEMTKAESSIPRFVGYRIMTYLSFFKDDERGGRKFEVWSGSLG